MSKEHFAVFQYFVSIIPTTFIDAWGRRLNTNQYSVNDYTRTVEHGMGVPGIFIKYDVEPLIMTIRERTTTLTQFLVRLAGILGGVWVCAGFGLRVGDRIMRVAGKTLGSGEQETSPEQYAASYSSAYARSSGLTGISSRAPGVPSYNPPQQPGPARWMDGSPASASSASGFMSGVRDKTASAFGTLTGGASHRIPSRCSRESTRRKEEHDLPSLEGGNMALRLAQDPFFEDLELCAEAPPQLVAAELLCDCDLALVVELVAELEQAELERQAVVEVGEGNDGARGKGLHQRGLVHARKRAWRPRADAVEESFVQRLRSMEITRERRNQTTHASLSIVTSTNLLHASKPPEVPMTLTSFSSASFGTLTLTVFSLPSSKHGLGILTPPVASHGAVGASPSRTWSGWASEYVKVASELIDLRACIRP
ncbi:hypothetical protein L7F22_007872 [Adiantum nelumboides]|nr:hypothetical protein [Adiantum nelumboides]